MQTGESVMKKIILMCLVTLIALMSYLTFMVQTYFSQPVKWEYLLRTPDDAKFQETIDELGVSSWELVFARRATKYNRHTYKDEPIYECIFKRRVYE